MSQLQRRSTDQQVKVLFQGYCQGQLARTDLQDLLGIDKSRFFALLKAYREDPRGFTIDYQRPAPTKLSSEAEGAIKAALLGEKAFVEGPDSPISSYDYTDVRGLQAVSDIKVPVLTIIDRANGLDCHEPRRRSRATRLVAAFNLSLEALKIDDEDAWEAFIWLGVLPEDVTMAAALWGGDRHMSASALFFGTVLWARTSAGS